MLHLLTGVLLCWLVYRIIGVLSTSKLAVYGTTLLSTGFWLLHPYNLSTVLYPVQRMAILSALFVILGLLVYTIGRQMIPSRPRRAHVLMSLAIIIGTITATFSKENGALLPLLVLVLEITVFSSQSYKPNRYWHLLFVVLPSLLIAGYLIFGVINGNITAGYGRRYFSLSERLMTEARILFDYLYYWFVPHIHSPGLLTEDIPLSTSLLSPPTTVLSIVGIATIITAGIRYRRTYPLASLAVLFFFAGHIIESTVIPLELYFEHRNYLPAIFLVMPIAFAAFHYAPRYRYLYAVSAILLVLLSVLLHQRAITWSSEESLAYQWAVTRKYSQRAQRYAALVAERHGKTELAFQIISRAKDNLPTRVAILIHWMKLACMTNRPLSGAEQSRFLQDIESGYFTFRSYAFIESSVLYFASDRCRYLDAGFSFQLLDALERNHYAVKLPGALHQIYHARGKLYLAMGLFDQALDSFIQSLKHLPRAETAMNQISALANAQQYDHAYRLLLYTKSNIPVSKDQQFGKIDFQAEIMRFEAMLLEDLKMKATDASR